MCKHLVHFVRCILLVCKLRSVVFVLWQYFGSPVGYIQQVVVRVAVLPLDTHLSLASEAVLKAALSTVFDVTEHIENFQLHNG